MISGNRNSLNNKRFTPEIINHLAPTKFLSSAAISQACTAEAPHTQLYFTSEP